MAINPERIATNFARTLRRSISRLELFMAELVAELDTKEGRIQTTQTNLARATLMRGQLTTRLNVLGFQGDVRTLYTDIADDLQREVGEDKERELIAETALSAFASGFTRSLDNAWFTMTGRIEQAVEQAMLTNAPITDLIAMLAGSDRESIRLSADLSAPFAQWLNWAESAVDTALSSLVRKIQIVEATNAGVEFFIYQGTTIATTRPFCRLMQGVVLRLEDLRAIESDPRFANLRRLRSGEGRQPPLVTSLGGWRCRHTLTATSLKRAKESGRTIFMDEGEDLNRRAGALA